MRGLSKAVAAAFVPKPHSPFWKCGGWPAAAAVLIFAIRIYRWTMSPAQFFLFGSTAGCRFTPTCSQFAVEAIRTRGAVAGGALAARRICRCHPWGDCGHDPVPKMEKQFALGNSI
jgi:putative membrane protein insertion efficiency factor